MGVEKKQFIVPTGVRTSNRQARSESLYRLRYPGPILVRITYKAKIAQRPKGANIHSFEMLSRECNSTITIKVSYYNNHITGSQLHIQEQVFGWILVSELGYPKTWVSNPRPARFYYAARGYISKLCIGYKNHTVI
jgi:hypothetical protein